MKDSRQPELPSPPAPPGTRNPPHSNSWFAPLIDLSPAAAFCVALCLFLPVAVFRLIDGDEGYLLLAATLVSRGRRLYSDFFFPQGPLLPWVFGAALSPFGGVTWYGARLLSAAAAAGAAAFVAANLRLQGRKGAWLPILGFATTSLAFAWQPIAKTYGLSTLCATAAYFVAAGERRREEVTWRAFGAGVLLGLAASARLYAIALAAPLAWTVAGRAGLMRRRLLLCGLGVAVGLLPLAGVLLYSPEQAFFGLVGYHLQRSDAGVLSLEKLGILAQLVGVEHREIGLALQFDLLAAFACIGVMAHWRRRAERLTALPWLLTVLIVSCVPTPAHVQYFTMAVPFLVELAVLGLDAVRESGRRGARRLLPWLGVIWVALAGIEAERCLHGGRHMPGVDSRTPAAQWTIPAVRRVAKALSGCRGADAALVSWPGYLVESTLQPAPGVENQFNREIADRIDDPAQRARLHLVTTRDLQAAQSTPAAPIVVMGAWTFPSDLSQPAPGRRLAKALAPVQVWVDDRVVRCEGLLAK